MPTTTTTLLAVNKLTAVPVFGVTTTELTIRMMVALGLITLAITTTTRLIARYRDRDTTTTQPIVIHHQQQLNKHTQLTLLTTGTRQLLIATNQHNTTLLAQGQDLTTPTKPTTPKPTKPATTTTAAAVGSGPTNTIDIRPKPRNPIKHLQNKTVRRA